MLVGLTMFFSITAFVLMIATWWSTSFATSQSVWTVSGPLSNFPRHHVLAGTIPLVMTLPNNMLEYVGKEYVVDCPTLVPHEVKFLPGALVTTWDGTNTIVTCTGPNAGFTFRVITQNVIRITSPASAGVVYSA